MALGQANWGVNLFSLLLAGATWNPFSVTGPFLSLDLHINFGLG